MAAGERYLPGWRDAAAYEPLLDADRSLFAWEWLRRQDCYRSAALPAFGRAAASQVENPAAVEWGLHIFEDPRLPVPLARAGLASGPLPVRPPGRRGERH